LGANHDLPAHLFPAVQMSNDTHKKWSQQALSFVLHNLSGLKIAIWGLTYKPGTDTLRRSTAVELCQWLNRIGARPQIHDPAVKALPEALRPQAAIYSDPVSALEGASALVVATEWPVFRSIGSDSVVAAMSQAAVIDPNRFLAESLGGDPRIRYYTVGKGF
jgi:UDPglucose 6-dehydrogenase